MHLSWLPRARHRSVPYTADHLEKATTLLLTVLLVLFSTNVGAPTAPFLRLPWPEPARLYRATSGTSRSAFQFTHQRTRVNDDFSVFPQPHQYHGSSLPTQLFVYPPINRMQTPTALQPSSTTQPRTIFPTTVHRRAPVDASVYIVFLISTLVRHHGVLFPCGYLFFLDVRVLLVQPSTDYVSVASEHRTVPLQPSVSESPSVPEETPATPIPPPLFCLNNPVGLPPEPRQSLPVPEGTSVTPLSPPPPYPNIFKGLPSEPVALLLSGYNQSEPGTGLGGLVPPFLLTYHHIPPFTFYELELIIHPGMIVSNRLLVWVGSIPPLYDPLLTFQRPPFSEFVSFCFSRALDPPDAGTYRTFEDRNRALPRPLRRPRRTMRVFHPGCRFRWATFPSLLTHHHHPPPSTGDAQTMHLSCWALAWVGSNPLPPASCTTTFCWEYVRQLTGADHTKRPSTPSPPQNLRRVYFGT